jgi:two-component system, OmpR family, sensor kinase
MRRLVPRGLRLRLVLAISAVSMATVAGSFFALHQTTAHSLRSRIDRELNEQYAEFNQRVVDRGGATDPARLEDSSRRFLSGQRYHPESRIFLITAVGRPDVTNQQRIVDEEKEGPGAERDEASEGGGGRGIVDASDGLTTVSTDETGKLRVLTAPVVAGGTRIGTFRVADPLTSVDQALASLRNKFIAVGIGALILSVTIAIWLANLISRPLRRMAAVASAVDSGDLSHRIDYRREDEVGVLAESFNHMLDRLEEAFRREREFVSDASHELRSPLTVLRGRIEQLADRADDSESIKSEADELMREVRRMERLTDDMLTLAKAERGGLVQRRRVPLDDFVEDLRRDLPLLGPRHYVVESSTTGLPRCCATWSRTPSATPPPTGTSRSRSARRTGPRCSSSATTAPASRPISSAGSSIASTGPTRDEVARKAGVGSGWRSRVQSSRRTAARSAPARPVAWGRRSPSGFPVTGLGLRDRRARRSRRRSA